MAHRREKKNIWWKHVIEIFCWVTDLENHQWITQQQQYNNKANYLLPKARPKWNIAWNFAAVATTIRKQAGNSMWTYAWHKRSAIQAHKLNGIHLSCLTKKNVSNRFTLRIQQTTKTTKAAKKWCWNERVRKFLFISKANSFKMTMKAKRHRIHKTSSTTIYESHYESVRLWPVSFCISAVYPQHAPLI